MFADMVGRIPVIDVSPVVAGGRYPAKAAVDEPFTVSATIFREGHDALNADVVLIDPSGTRRPWVRMTKLPDPVDRWAAEVAPDAPGAWSFEIEAWSDPFATWKHNAEIKVAAGIDVELMFTEGVLLLERLRDSLPGKATGRKSQDHKTVDDAISGLQDARRPDDVRYAAAVTPAVDDVLPTIRSRCRHLSLRTPSTSAVAEVLVRRDDVDPAMAAFAARAAQGHIGRAKRLAVDELHAEEPLLAAREQLVQPDQVRVLGVEVHERLAEYARDRRVGAHREAAVRVRGSENGFGEGVVGDVGGHFRTWASCSCRPLGRASRAGVRRRRRSPGAPRQPAQQGTRRPPTTQPRSQASVERQRRPR